MAKNSDVKHVGTYRCHWEPEKLSKADIFCYTWYFPVQLLLWVAALFRLLVSTWWASMCVLVFHLIPLWRSQLRHLRLRYHKWKDRHSVTHHVWCLPAFMTAQLPTLFCSLVRATSISWTQIGLLQQELIPLWSCGVQHLRPYSCNGKVKQRDKGVISCHVWYLPALIMSLLTALACIICVGLHQQFSLETFVMVNNMSFMLNFHLPLVGLWWGVAVVQSREQSSSHHYSSKCCYSGCSMCSDRELGKGRIVSGCVFEGRPATKVCFPLKHRCCGVRKVQYVFHDEDRPNIVTVLLMLSGDVETNPGPGNTRLQQDHYGILCEQLRPCAPKWKEIALSLQFSFHEIESIASNPMNLTPNSCLDDVIRLWLQWAPGDIRGGNNHATLEQLQQAVDKAGYGALSLELTLSDPADDELDKSMKSGNVDVQGIDSVLVGVGGAGKTHTLNMIVNRPTPTKRVSTTCIRPPVRVMMKVDDKVVEVVGREQYFDIVVDTAKHVGSSIKLPHSPTKQRKVNIPKYMQKLEEEMHRHLAKGEDKPKLLYRLRWNRLMDCGGQPQFLEILPIFIHHISLGIIVIKLNERLDCFPMMEFYNEEGKVVGEPYKSCYSQEHVVRFFLRGLTSQAGEGKDVKFLFIGTHKDRMGECDESLEDKNNTLREIIRSFNMESNVIYNMRDLIFPINAKTPGNEDWAVMKHIRCKLVETTDVPRIRIPVRWFAMELALQRFVLETNQAVLLESKCLELVANFHFDENDFKAALRYLHQVKHIYYYEDGLKGLVVADIQIIQNKLCELVSYNIELRTNPNRGEALGLKWKKFCDRCILHSSCLNRFPDGYIEGVFSPRELLQLFQSLCIVSELGSDEYLMPCALPTEEIPCCNPDPKTQVVPAMVVEFPGGPMLGLFCDLVCYLMNTAKWKLAEHRGVPIHITRSSIHFYIPGIPGKVTFNDPLSNFFTLTFHGPMEDAPEVCPLIRETILTGIEEVSKILKHIRDEASSRADPNITFLCPCDTVPLHPAVMSRNGKRLLHPDDAGKYTSITNLHQMWLFGFVTKRDLTIQNIVGILTEEPYHWISVAKLLKIPDDCIGEASLLESKEKSLKVITEWWVTNTANADWSRISQILKGTIAECNRVTEKVHTILSEAIYFGYLDVAEEAVKRLDSFFSAFEDCHAGFDTMFGKKLSGLQYCQKYKGAMKYSGHSLLMVALEEGNYEIAEYLIQQRNFILTERKPEELIQNEEFVLDHHLTALHIACQKGQSEIVPLIVEAARKQKVIRIGTSGEYVSYQPNLDDIMNLEGPEGLTPLMYAVKGGHLETVKKLTASPNLRCDCRNQAGENVYHIAAAVVSDATKEVVEELLMTSCPLDDIDCKNGNTALHVAYIKANEPVKEILLKASKDKGLNLEAVKNKDGKMPKELEQEELIPYEVTKRGKKAVDAYRRALNDGKGKIPYCSLLILGKENVGKTSLLRQLVGKPFRKEWLSTRGIEPNAINTSRGACADEDTLQNRIDATAESWCEAEGESDLFTDALARDLHERLPESSIPKIAEAELMKQLQELVYDGTISAGIHEEPPVPSPEQKASVPSASADTPSEGSVPRPSKSPTQVKKMSTIVSKSSTQESTGAESVCSLDWRERDKLNEKIIRKQSYNPSVVLNVLDFAGQDMYRPMHHCFITRRALYLIVFKLPVMCNFIHDPKSVKDNPLDDICYWIRSINAHISAHPGEEEAKQRVLLVGTRRDELKACDLQNIDNFLKRKLMDSKDERYVNHIYCECLGPAKYFIPVENSIDSATGESYSAESGTNLVQKTIKAMSETLPHMNEVYPIKWLQFEERLKNCHTRGICPIVKTEETKKVAVQSGISDEDQQKEALRFFHDTGKIIWFEYLPRLFLNEGQDSHEEIRDLVMLDPGWLMTAMQDIVELNTDHSSYAAGCNDRTCANKPKKLDYKQKQQVEQHGIADYGVFEICWEKFKSSSITIQQLCLIFQAYCLIYPLQNCKDQNKDQEKVKPNMKYIIPCKLPEVIRNKQICKEVQSEYATFYVDFQDYLPDEIYHKLICLALKNCDQHSRTGELQKCFSKKMCYFADLKGTNWVFEMDEKTQQLKIMFQWMDERVPADNIKLIHEEYLYEICKDSGFQGLTYHGGPKVFCKKCRGEIVLPFVEYKRGKEEVKKEQLRCVNRHAIAFDVNKILRSQADPRIFRMRDMFRGVLCLFIAILLFFIQRDTGLQCLFFCGLLILCISMLWSSRNNNGHFFDFLFLVDKILKKASSSITAPKKASTARHGDGVADVPTLEQLTSMGVIDKVDSEWRMIAILTGQEDDLNGIWTQSMLDIKCACRIAFKKWIDKGGHAPNYPLTWQGLYDLLCKVGHDGIANKVADKKNAEGASIQKKLSASQTPLPVQT